MPVAVGRGCSESRWRLERRVLEQELEILKINRFDEVGVEAGRLRPLAVLFLAVAGHGHEGDVLECGIFPANLGDFVAVHDRQPDVQEDDVGFVAAGQLDGFFAVMGGLHLLAEGEEKLFEAGGVDQAVINHKDSPARKVGSLASSVAVRFGSDGHTTYGARKADGELTSGSRPFAVNAHLALVHLDQRSNDSQADAQAAARARERLIGLNEEVKDLGQELGGDSDSGVGNLDLHVGIGLDDHQVDAAPLWGVFGGVVQEVGEDLGHAAPGRARAPAVLRGSEILSW